MSSEVFVAAVGLAAPGLPDWSSALPVLRGEAPYQSTELPPYQPQLLPPNERRRAPAAVRQAFRAAEDAVARSPRPAAELATVFATAEADIGIINRICDALTTEARVISPTDFHNSVHNAAAGYWSIAIGARGPSTTICAHDESLAAGLLEAAALTLADGRETLLVVYDVPPPSPMYEERPIATAVSTALLLAPGRSPGVLGSLRLHPEGPGEDTTMDDPALEQLRRSNPAARALPLLRLLARGDSGEVRIGHSGGGSLRLTVGR